MILKPAPLRERLLDSSGRRFADPRSHFSRIHRQRGFLSVFQSGQFGRSVLGSASVVNNDLIRLLFNGANGAQVFTDDGTAGTTWTPSGAAVTTSTTSPIEGTASLSITSNTAHLDGAWTSANWVTTGSWFIGGWATVSSIGINQAICGVTDATNTAAGTAWIIYVLTDNKVRGYFSSGTVLTPIIFNGSTVAANTPFYWSAYMQSSVIYLQKDGAAGAATLSLATLNTPSGKNLSFGKVPSDNGPASCTQDTFQCRRSLPAGVSGGSSFTPPGTGGFA